MFGLKLIRKYDFDNLKRDLMDANVLLNEKYAIISNLEKENAKLKKELDKLKVEEKPKKRNSKTVLLTDVAEEALKVESKPRRRKKDEVITK